MFSRRLSFIDKNGNLDPMTAYVHSEESVKEYVEQGNSKGYIVVVEDDQYYKKRFYNLKKYKGVRL